MIYKNAILLGLCQFLLMVSVSVGLSFNGLVGKAMAPSLALATVPYLTMTISTALLTLALPQIFSRLGYARSFAFGAILGIMGSLGAALGIWFDSFYIFCGAGILMGAYQASALYYRFAAADSVSSQQHKSTAIAWVMNGGIIAALLGPVLASNTLHWFSLDYLGSYIAVAIIVVLALPITLLLRLPGRQQETVAGIPFLTILALPSAKAAVLFCAGSYAMMMLVMLASPLAMAHCGYSAADAASVIQWHLLGMFAPSLLTGNLVTRWGAVPIAGTGALILIAGCVIALSGIELNHFHWALLLVGIGWNFMYLGGSTIITQVSDAPARVRLQSLNEFVTFAVMTLTAGATGWIFEQLAWGGVLAIAVAFIAVIAIFVIFERWQGNKKVTASSQA
jgi:MFS family permease